MIEVKCCNCGKRGQWMPRPIPPDYLCNECVPLFRDSLEMYLESMSYRRPVKIQSHKKNGV